MNSTSGHRLRRLVITAVAVVTSLSVAAPAGAYSVDESGLVGVYGYIESEATPFATCTYDGPVGPSNWIWLRWLRVTAPVVMAADRNSDRRDKRTVTFQMKIQRAAFDSIQPWTVVASSKVQRATAYDDAAAPLSPIKLYFTPKKTFNNGQKAIFRTLVVIKWLKKDGSVEGTAKIWPDYYKINSPWSPQPFTTDNGYCGAVSTNG